MKAYGYIRVSSKDQNMERQIQALKEAGVEQDNIFSDKQSGKDFERPAYKQMLKAVKKGDCIYVKSIDRLGRNYEEIIEQWKEITKDREVDIVVLDMPLLDTRQGKDLLGTFISDLVLQLLSFVAQMERDFIRTRQAEGIAAARARGKKWGNPEKSLPKDFEAIYARWQAGEISVMEMADMCKMHRSTLYRKLKKQKEREN